MYKAGDKENGLKTPLWCLYCISLTYLSGKLTYKCMYDGVALHTHNICEIQFKPVFVRLWFIPSILICGEMLACDRLSVYFGWVGGRERAPSHSKERHTEFFRCFSNSNRVLEVHNNDFVRSSFLNHVFT